MCLSALLLASIHPWTRSTLIICMQRQTSLILLWLIWSHKNQPCSRMAIYIHWIHSIRCMRCFVKLCSLLHFYKVWYFIIWTCLHSPYREALFSMKLTAYNYAEVFHWFDSGQIMFSPCLPTRLTSALTHIQHMYIPPMTLIKWWLITVNGSLVGFFLRWQKTWFQVTCNQGGHVHGQWPPPCSSLQKGVKSQIARSYWHM